VSAFVQSMSCADGAPTTESFETPENMEDPAIWMRRLDQ